jgi:hypothetical protein
MAQPKIGEAELHRQIEVAIQELVRKGLLVDSGKKRWSERTKSYQTLWVAAND